MIPFRVPVFERRPHTPKDWLGIVIIFSAAFLAVNFILTQASLLRSAIGEQEIIDEYAFQALKYKWILAMSDSTPEKTYEALRLALLNNDPNGVISLIHPDYLWKYKKGLQESWGGKLQDAGRSLISIEKVEVIGNFARYRYTYLSKATNGLFELYPYVEFTRDFDGIWKISSI